MAARSEALIGLAHSLGFSLPIPGYEIVAFADVGAGLGGIISIAKEQIGCDKTLNLEVCNLEVCN